MICVIDNNDSFVCNLVQYAGNLGADCVVHRNDEVTVEQVVDLDPELIIISPGPGDPESLFTEQGVGLVGQRGARHAQPGVGGGAGGRMTTSVDLPMDSRVCPTSRRAAVDTDLAKIALRQARTAPSPMTSPTSTP